MSQLTPVFNTQLNGTSMQLLADNALRKFVLSIGNKNVLNLKRWFSDESKSRFINLSEYSIQLKYRCFKDNGTKLIVGLFVENLPYKMALFDLDKKCQLPFVDVRYDLLT